MNIAVDVDDVLADFISQVILFHNAKYETKLQKEDFFSTRYYEVWGGTKTETHEKLDKFYETDYFKEIIPVPDSLKAVSFLKNLGHDLYLVTGRRDSLIPGTSKWIEKHFPNIFSGIYNTNTFVADASLRKNKSLVCKELNISVMIDDDLMHIHDCVSSCLQVLVFNQPWNQKVLPSKAIRVLDWNDVIEIIKS
ncbi:MAG: hypothetical protein WC662_00585 [Candidatus Paceibacterota bacterium]|jgi:uncharacterized HAD superfamily protein